MGSPDVTFCVDIWVAYTSKFCREWSQFGTRMDLSLLPDEISYYSLELFSCCCWGGEQWKLGTIPLTAVMFCISKLYPEVRGYECRERQPFWLLWLWGVPKGVQCWLSLVARVPQELWLALALTRLVCQGVEGGCQWGGLLRIWTTKDNNKWMHINKICWSP